VSLSGLGADSISFRAIIG